MPKINNASLLNGFQGVPAKKFWNIALLNEDEAEITLYGEIVPSKPVDWWTGEPLPGLYISLDEFIKDVKQVENSSKITIRINSVGGDYFTGATIRSRLSELKGEKTVIIDGLAASAASVIAMAGDIIKMHRGSLMMIHEPMIRIFEWLQLADLDRYRTELEAVSNALVEVYLTKSHMSAKDVRKLLAEEKWMGGDEAVEKGFANEVIDAEVSVSVSNDLSHFISNGVSMSTAGIRNMPKNIPIVLSQAASAVPQAIDKNLEKEGKKMEFKTVLELTNACPDLVAQIQDAAKQEGIKAGTEAERQRLKNIDEFASSVADKDLVQNAKYGESPMNAEQLAFQIVKNHATMGAQFLTLREQENTASGAQAVAAIPNAGNPLNSADIERQAEQDAAGLIVAGFNQQKGVHANV